MSLEYKQLLLYPSVKMSLDKVGYFGTNNSWCDRKLQSLSPNNIPYRGVANFVERDKKLAEVHKKLLQNDSAAIFALAGMLRCTHK